MSGASPQLCRTLSKKPLSLLLCSRVWSCELHDQGERRRLGKKQKEISEGIKETWIQLCMSQGLSRSPPMCQSGCWACGYPPIGPRAFPVVCVPQPTPPPTIYPAFCASCQHSFNISPSSEYSGLISFRMDWLDLLAVQGTLKSLLQHHSSKASILQRSAFFIVQLSHPYMTTGKTIALTWWTFVGKVMSLLFNML